MLDMSAACVAADHDILLKRLQLSFGIHGTILSWITSFVRDRMQTVIANSKTSETSSVISDVSHGSVLGPILFLLCIEDVAIIAKKHGLNFYSYAADCELYISVKADESVATASRVVSFIYEVNC